LLRPKRLAARVGRLEARRPHRLEACVPRACGAVPPAAVFFVENEEIHR